MTQDPSTHDSIRAGEPPYRPSSPAFDDVAMFVCQEAGVRRAEVNEKTSLQGDIGLYGDDMEHLIFEYARKYSVDLTGYLWYFHTGEEGTNIGGLFFAPPNARVEEIPITIGMLHEFANAGRWGVEYPKHELPRWRIDTWIDVLVAITLVGSCLGSCLYKSIVG